MQSGLLRICDPGTALSSDEPLPPDRRQFPVLTQYTWGMSVRQDRILPAPASMGSIPAPQEGWPS